MFSMFFLLIIAIVCVLALVAMVVMRAFLARRGIYIPAGLVTVVLLLIVAVLGFLAARILGF